MTYTLWGSAHSLYTGKARSYLIKKGLAFRERYPSDPDFGARILPQVGLFVIPVLETPDGACIQDTGAIIDYLEARHPDPALEPVTPVQRVVSRLFDAYGSEALMGLAMHYRWTYRDQQEQFLRAEFGRTMVAGANREDRRTAAAKSMAIFNAFLPGLGICPDVIPAMEAAWLAMMDALDEHFQWHPYLLGGRPCRADFGLLAPLFAHLGRDPVPAGLMKTRAPNLFRWTERMNMVAITDGEYPGYGADYTPDDGIPATLERVMQLVFADWTEGLKADAACFNAWAADKASGTLVSRNGERQVHPNVGKVSYPYHGVMMTRGGQPHMLWMLAEAQRAAAAATDAARTTLDALMARTGGTEVLGLKVNRAMKRVDNVLVLA